MLGKPTCGARSPAMAMAMSKLFVTEGTISFVDIDFSPRNKIKTFWNNIIVSKNRIYGHYLRVHITYPNQTIPFYTIPQIIQHQKKVSYTKDQQKRPNCYWMY